MKGLSSDEKYFFPSIVVDDTLLLAKTLNLAPNASTSLNCIPVISKYSKIFWNKFIQHS